MFTVRSLYTGVISVSVRFNVMVISHHALYSAGHSGGLGSLRSVDLQEVR